MVFLWVLWNGGEGALYSSGEENMNARAINEVDKGSKGIMNLIPISNFWESWCIKCRDW